MPILKRHLPVVGRVGPASTSCLSSAGVWRLRPWPSRHVPTGSELRTWLFLERAFEVVAGIAELLAGLLELA